MLKFGLGTLVAMAGRVGWLFNLGRSGVAMLKFGLLGVGGAITGAGGKLKGALVLTPLGCSSSLSESQILFVPLLNKISWVLGMICIGYCLIYNYVKSKLCLTFSSFSYKLDVGPPHLRFEDLMSAVPLAAAAVPH